MKLQEIIYANQVLKTVIDNADIEITPKLKFKLLGIMKESSLLFQILKLSEMN